MDVQKQLAEELNLNLWQVEAAVNLIDSGNTVPFIARYRKEATGSLDDGQLRSLNDRLGSLRNLEKRREEIINAVTELGVMTDELLSAIGAAKTLSALEDLYMPYKKKKRTRATAAKEKGLEPLALEIFAQTSAVPSEKLAEKFIDEEKGVTSVQEAVQGAMDIIAEMISDNAEIRGDLRRFMQSTAVITSYSDTDQPGTYSNYYDYKEPVKSIAPHRLLAINRGEKEGVLKVSLDTDMDRALSIIMSNITKDKNSLTYNEVAAAAADSLKRLLYPSLENELRSMLTENAAEQAIKVFALNLKPLLMQPPLKGQVIMGFDPAYRTGCKIAVVDKYGKVLDTTVVYPTPPQNKTQEAAKTLKELIEKHGVTAIAIGNGTASKESEIFVADLIRDTDVKYMVVSEAGASVYSASELAAKEFPQFDVSLRSAVSIARRLLDPLAELVKIEPKAIGVGQYQHDMPQKRLNEALFGVVESCVNSVGVDVNTASQSLLSYVAGIGPQLAKNIVSYREENGGFQNRKELKKVPKLGEKAFLQCAGFLRISDGTEPLDATAVHPESYGAAKELLKICTDGEQDKEKGFDFKHAAEYLDKIDLKKAAEQLGIGLPTLKDIAEELQKPGRDPRDELPPPLLRSDLLSIEDLKPEMILTGTVRNVVDFGAFVDIGVHQDGLVHISKISDKFIKHPSEAVRVGDIVKVKILEVDIPRKRITLTMRDI
jgi:tex-like protein-like protein